MHELAPGTARRDRRRIVDRTARGVRDSPYGAPGIAACAAATDGWLYLVSLTGTTGARDDVSPALAGLVQRTRALTSVPLYAGFGISTPAHAAAVAELADGVVVGSRAVQVAVEGPEALRAYVASLRAGAEGPRVGP